jgi:protein-L-isoaspartate(D-aspartate) O-methyltransferase
MMRVLKVVAAGLVLVLMVAGTSAVESAPAAEAGDDYAALRARMVKQIMAQPAIRRHVRRADRERVAAAMASTPRELFVPDDQRPFAYEDRSLPIGYEQTISAPSMVALMTGLLRLKKGDRVLEIGTGSGYQAAVLSRLVDQVYTIEIVEPLATQAAARLNALDHSNVHTRVDDGYTGWPTTPAFDAIIVTAGATHLPDALVAQLKPGGRMVIPLGPNWAQEELILATKRKDGLIGRKSFGQVFFVDFTGQMKRKQHR